MRLTFDFSALWAEVNRIGGKREAFVLTSHRPMDLIDVKLSERGLEVKLDELENIGDLLTYKGRQVLLYIPDQGQSIDEVLSGDQNKGKKFHVAHCRTLENMRGQGRFERYFAITNPTGSFPVSGVSRAAGVEVSGNASLYVCLNCLSQINYRQSALSSSMKYKARAEFEIAEFFETYSSCFTYFPQRSGSDPGKSGYTDDWKDVSERIRRHANWCCNDCGVDLKERKDLLHVHHRDGNKANNTPSNLRPLCAACHRDQPMHETLFIKYDDMVVLVAMRRDQSLIGRDWPSVIKQADSALRGVLELAKSKGWVAPEIAYPLPDSRGHLRLDAAWPDQRLGVALSPSNKVATKGWSILGLSEALAWSW
jgi:hypothetical protein